MVISVHELIEARMLTENDLLSGELIIEGRLVDASNATLFGHIKKTIDEQFPVVYKPIAGERPLWDFPDGNLASREVAAYVVSQIAKFNCVPITVLRDGPFGVGAVQVWIDTDEKIDVFAFGQSQVPAIRNMALFDVVINNTDRKFGHILPISEDQILGCDHGVAFHQEFKLRTVLWQFAGAALDESERCKLERLHQWLTSQESSVLTELLTNEEISAMQQRMAQLLESGFPYPSEDWPAIPWPPV